MFAEAPGQCLAQGLQLGPQAAPGELSQRRRVAVAGAANCCRICRPDTPRMSVITLESLRSASAAPCAGGWQLAYGRA